jgi:hypothetical protein
MIYVTPADGPFGRGGAALTLTILKERMHGKRVKAIGERERESEWERPLVFILRYEDK